MQTFWLKHGTSSRRSSLSTCASEGSFSASQRHLGESPIWGVGSELSNVDFQRNKHQRLIDYNVDLLATHLKRIVARRRVTERGTRRASQILPPELDAGALSSETSTVLDEVVEVIRLPKFDPKAFKVHVDPESIELEPAVLSQLKRYVTVVSAMYRQNPFHSM